METSTVVMLTMVLVFLGQLYTSARVGTMYRELHTYKLTRNLSGAKIAEIILKAFKLESVKILPVNMRIREGFNVVRNSLLLKEDTFFDRTVAATISSAAVTGQAVQFNLSKYDVAIAKIILPCAQISKKIVYPVFIVGFIFGIDRVPGLAAILWSLIILLQTVLIYTEQEAGNITRRALVELHILVGEEVTQSERYFRLARWSGYLTFLFSVLYLVKLLSN
jgi:uncharacterized protein